MRCIHVYIVCTCVYTWATLHPWPLTHCQSSDLEYERKKEMVQELSEKWVHVSLPCSVHLCIWTTGVRSEGDLWFWPNVLEVKGHMWWSLMKKVLVLLHSALQVHVYVYCVQVYSCVYLHVRGCILHWLSRYFPTLSLTLVSTLQVPAAGEGQVQRLGPTVRDMGSTCVHDEEKFLFRECL